MPERTGNQHGPVDRLRTYLHGHPGDRGQRRVRRVGMTGLATLFSRGVTVLVGLATLPITSHYLGKERFGLWLTLSSLMAWIVIADLGIAVSLINALSTADGRDDRATAKRSVASAFWMTAIMAVLLIAVSLASVDFINWQVVFNLVSPLAIDEAGSSVLVLLVLCALRLPSSIIGCTYQAYQEGYIYQIWSGLGGLCGAAGLVLAVMLEAGLPWLVGAWLGGMLLTDVLSGIYLFGHRKAWLFPSILRFDPAEAKWLIRRGAQFWIAQVSAIFMLQIDLLIVSLLFGASEAGIYGTALRLYLLIGAIQAAFIAPLWAAYGEALARHDFEWIVRTFKMSLKISLLLIIPAGLLICLTMPYAFRLLVTEDIRAGIDLRLALMFSEICNAAARCIATFLNGIGSIRSQVIFGPVGAVFNIILSVLLGRLMGPAGVALATAACLLIIWIAIIGQDAGKRIREFSINYS